MNEHKKPSIIGPGVSSFIMIILLYVLPMENTQEKPSDILEMFKIFSLLLFSFAAIWIWQKYLKEYVAFEIEQKLREINKKPED